MFRPTRTVFALAALAPMGLLALPANAHVASGHAYVQVRKCATAKTTDTYTVKLTVNNDGKLSISHSSITADVADDGRSPDAAKDELGYVVKWRQGDKRRDSRAEITPASTVSGSTELENRKQKWTKDDLKPQNLKYLRTVEFGYVTDAHTDRERAWPVFALDEEGCEPE